MKKIVIHCTTTTGGTDSWEFFEVPNDYSGSSLDSLANECALGNAEMYGIYPPSDSYDEFDNGEPVEDDNDSTDDNIEGYWELYDAEKHDGHTMTGVPEWQTN